MEAHPFTTRVMNAALTYLPHLTPGLRSSSASLLLSLAIRRLGDAHDRALDQATAGLPPRELTAALKLSRQTVHQNCKRLVEAGWLEAPRPEVYRAGFLLQAVIDIAREAGPSHPWWEE